MTQQGSVSSDTMRLQDLIPCFLEVLRQDAPDKYSVILEEWRDSLPHTGERDVFSSDKFARWIEQEPEEASYLLNEDIWDAMNEIAPDGCYFGAHPGDGADYGFWQVKEF